MCGGIFGGIESEKRGYLEMLTDTQARKAAPRDKPYKLADSGGLYLHVMPSGARYWRLKYRHGGKEKVLAILSAY